MYRQTIIPTEKNHTIDLPEDLYGKSVEVIINEFQPSASQNKYLKKKLPDTLKDKNFWEDIEYNVDFPSINKIRQTAWPKRKR